MHAGEEPMQTLKRILAFVAVVSLTGALASGQTMFTFDPQPPGTSVGDWHVAANWTGGLPGRRFVQRPLKWVARTDAVRPCVSAR